MARKDYYSILGIKKNATEQEIKNAYHKLALKWHPDRWSTKSPKEKEDAEKMFKEIGEAYGILSDQNKKWEYDNDTDKPDYSDGKEGSEFECAGCHNKSTYHYHEISEGDKKYIFCGYSCLFDCANPLCISEGKCYEKLITSRSTKGNFCLKKCFQEFKEREDKWANYNPDQGNNPGQNGENNSQKECCKCNKPISNGEESFLLNGGWTVCRACVIKKCVQCGEQGVPVEGSDWVSYREIGYFCCPEHYELWKKDNNQNQGEPEGEEEIFEPPQRTKPPKTNGKEKGENGSETEENDSDNDSFDNDSETDSDSSSNNIPTTGNHGNKGTNELPENIQKLANLPLAQSKQKSEQEIEKMLKDSGIQESDLGTKNLSGKSDWKTYLRSLDSPQKVAQFTYQMQQAILQKVLDKKNSVTEQKKPEDGAWVKPVVISVLSLLALSTLIIIIRKRRK